MKKLCREDTASTFEDVNQCVLLFCRVRFNFLNINKMLENLKNTTDFTIDCILSKNDIKSEIKLKPMSKEIIPYLLLNKVGENPWIPKIPFPYNSGLIQKVQYLPNSPLNNQSYLSHMHQFNYVNTEPIDYCGIKTKSNNGSSSSLDYDTSTVAKFNSSSTITSGNSSSFPNSTDTPNKYSYSQQSNVYDYSKFCDKFVLNSLTINLSGDHNQLGFYGSSSSSSLSSSSSPIINYDNNMANQKCSICSKVFDSLISLDVSS